MSSLRYPGAAARAAGAALVLLLALQVGVARASEPCISQVMYIAAHEDDTLLFQSPNLIRDIRSNHCVRTVFLTAGDAGKGAEYWEGREAGAEVAYAQMAGVANSWSGSTLSVEGHSIHLETLNGAPGISIAYMRLPDGGTTGSGFPLYGEQSLLKLWRGGTGGSPPTISSIEAVDGSATYTYQGLIDTLEALMDDFGARQIATQNYLQSYPGPDHADHVATADFTQKAHQRYGDPHRLTGYQDYETASLAENVGGELLSIKEDAFYEYGKHDSDACTSKAACTGTSYEKWLRRQYIAGRETTGVVANAGYTQTTTASTAVTLDGSESSRESPGALQYTWTQTGGPAVTLSGANTVTPSFVTPSHPTLLTFSLVVEAGATSSAPSVVKVRVPSSDPDPVAIAGSDQSVLAGAGVKLNGSESWDPNSLPLQYSWSQTSGPAVTLSGGATATPSFVAPGVPATVKFSLTVSNGTQTSGPSSVTVEVKGVAPVFTSAPSATFAVGTQGSFTIVTSGAPAAALTLIAGSLPLGLKFSDNGNGTATISGSAAPVTAAVGETRGYPLTVRADNVTGGASQAFALLVVNNQTHASPSSQGGSAIPPSPPAPEGSKSQLRLSKAKVRLRVGKASRHLVRVRPRPLGVRCVGRLPKGARCRVTAAGNVVVEATRRVRKAGTYRLSIVVTGSEGVELRPLVVSVKRKNRRKRL